MSETKKATPAKKNRKKKPLRRAERWGAQVLPTAGKLLTLLLLVSVMGMIFSALQAIGALWLRAALAGVLVAGALALYFSDGLTKGAADAAASRYYVSAKEKGIELDAKDDAACYHLLKPVCACAVVFAVPLALAVFIALTAQEYTYVLQDLPAWMTNTYGAREDVFAPLGAYMQETGMTVRDWVRMAVRLPEMLYINFFPDALTQGALIDRLSPLMIATYPLAYILGYVFGPKSNRKRESMNRRAKKVAVRRAQKSSLVEELTGARPQVHYGHKKDEDKPKRKELI